MPDASTAGPRPLSLEIAEHPGGAPHRLELELDRGHLYRVIVSQAAVRTGLLTRLIETGRAAVVPADGGQIGNLKVWENMVLPCAWRGGPRYPELEERARMLLRAFGYDGGRFTALCAVLPERLSRLELRLVAFVRAMLSEPEIMVYDCLFDGLTHAEVGQVLRFDRLFHLHFPFRTSIHLDLELPSLPELKAHRQFVLR